MIQIHRHSIEDITIQIGLVVISIKEMFKENVLQTKQIVTVTQLTLTMSTKLSCVFLIRQDGGGVPLSYVLNICCNMQISQC